MRILLTRWRLSRPAERQQGIDDFERFIFILVQAAKEPLYREVRPTLVKELQHPQTIVRASHELVGCCKVDHTGCG